MEERHAKSLILLLIRLSSKHAIRLEKHSYFTGFVLESGSIPNKTAALLLANLRMVILLMYTDFNL